MRSPTKRLHFDREGSGKDGLALYDTDNMTLSEFERLDIGKAALKKNGGVSTVEYVRSTSLPAREHGNGDGDEFHSLDASQNGNETGIPDHSRSDSAIDQEKVSKETAVNSSCSETTNLTDLTNADQIKKVKENTNKLTNQERTNNEGASPLNGAGDGSALVSPELEVPTNFNFLGSTDNATGEGLPIQEAGTNEFDDRGKTEEGVFVFTATTTSSSTDPSSPDYVKSKQKPTGSVTFNLTPEEIGRVGEGERDEMVLLAQQLELGGSDNVSVDYHYMYVYSVY